MTEHRISANDPQWRTKAIQLMEQGKDTRFVITDCDDSEEMRNDCIALAQEHDFSVCYDSPTKFETTRFAHRSKLSH